MQLQDRLVGRRGYKTQPAMQIRERAQEGNGNRARY